MNNIDSYYKLFHAINKLGDLKNLLDKNEALHLAHTVCAHALCFGTGFLVFLRFVKCFDVALNVTQI